jgi:MFS family permease
MDRRAALVLLAVLAVGVFLAGLELMITAVALPSIVTDLADWTALRRASWIVNAYLLASVVAMPLAGRLVDLWGARRIFLLALGLFTIGSLLAGRSGSLDELIAARVVQAVGGGFLIPVATAAASHLFDGPARPRALGVIGGLTFLGMAAGPFLGAAILEALHPAPVLDAAGISDGPLREALAATWRYVFYVNVPIGLAALAIGWAASSGWETPRRAAPIDLAGAALFSLTLACLVAGLTLLGSSEPIAGVDPGIVVAGLISAAVLGLVASAVRGFRLRDPYLDPRHFTIPAFGSAALVSLLTGYGFATAIVGGAVFVDRVLYGGPDTQRVVLGALAGATAVGALASGFVARRAGLRVVTVAGLGLSAGALGWMTRWTAAVTVPEVALVLAVFGLGFGLTVTARSTAAVEAVGRAAYGAASSTVTVARMIGMAVGLAILTADGSTTIDRLAHQVYDVPDGWKAYVPQALWDRGLRDGLVVDSLERWAAGEAARIMGAVFLVAALVTAAAVVPALIMGRRRILGEAPAGAEAERTEQEAAR